MAELLKCMSKKGFNVRLEVRVKNAQLVNARESLGLSAKSVAERMGIHYVTYLGFESMQRYPSEESQKKVCDFYRGNEVFLFEQDVFPQELKSVRPQRRYVMEKEIPREKLFSLSDISRKFLPNIEETAETLLEQQEEKQKLSDRLESVLSTLNYREREVLKLKYGLSMDGHEFTNGELATIFKVSSSRIRQIMEVALRKLRHPVRSSKLKDFLPEGIYQQIVVD